MTDLTPTAAAEPLPPPHPGGLDGPAPLAYFTNLYADAVLADRKATFALTTSGLLLSVLAFFSGRIAAAVQTAGALGVALAVLVGSVVAALLASSVFAWVAYRRLLPPTPPSLAVFRDVARLTPDDYRRAMYALSGGQALRDMLLYNHVAAAWAATKFRVIAWSMTSLRGGILMWMALLVIIALTG